MTLLFFKKWYLWNEYVLHLKDLTQTQLYNLQLKTGF